MSWGAVTIGAGAASALRGPGAGRVVGTFSRGFYVRTAAGIAAVGGPTVPPGPVHVTLERDPPTTVEGEVVAVGGGSVTGAGWQVDLRGGRPFAPGLPPPDRLGALAEALAVAAGDRWPCDVDVTPKEVAARVEQGDLDGARRLLEGRGGGLTPAGDDVLAGLLLVRAWAQPQASGPPEVAAAARTTELSRTFLRWAAVGQSVQPVHDVVDAAMRGDLAAVEGAAREFAHWGSSSGPALLAGLRLAAALA